METKQTTSDQIIDLMLRPVWGATEARQYASLVGRRGWSERSYIRKVSKLLEKHPEFAWKEGALLITREAFLANFYHTTGYIEVTLAQMGQERNRALRKEMGDGYVTADKLFPKKAKEDDTSDDDGGVKLEAY